MKAQPKNFHVSDAPGSELFVIGAEDDASLRLAAERLARFVEGAQSARLRDIAFTCAVEAGELPRKLAIVASSHADLSEKLGFAIHRLEAGIVRNSFNRGIYIGTEQCPAPGRTVFLFPGEGTQYPDMLRELALHFPACRAAFDAADTAVASALPDMAGASAPFLPSHYIFPTSTGRGDIRSLDMPMAIQTVLAADTALLFLFSQLGLAPDAVMGVGLGELVALECAGSIRLPSKKNRIMMLGEGFRMITEITSNKKLVPDCVTLSVAGASRTVLSALLEPFGDGAIIAADQASELFAVAVSPEAEKQVRAAIAGAGLSCRELGSIGKPFHTRLMEPVAGRFASYYGRHISALPSIPVYSCHTCGPMEAKTPAEIAEAAARQWTNPIDVGKTIERLYDDGYRVFVELGARGGLTACVGTTLRRKPHLAVAVNRGHRSDMLQLHHALAALVSHGARFDASVLHASRGSQRLDFDHPGDYKPPKRLQEFPVAHQMPRFGDIAIPSGLATRASEPTKSPAAQDGQQDGETPGSTDFPCIDFAEVLRFAPNGQIELSMRFSVADFPYIKARALAGSPVSAFDKGAMGFTPPPVELLAEIMGETARKLCPGKVVTRIEKLVSAPPVAAHDAIQEGMRIQARQTAMRGGTAVVEAAVFGAASFQADAPEAVASCTIVLADTYPEPPAETPLALKNSIRAGWTHEDIYSMRIPAGECCRALKSIAETGDNGLAAECFIPPRSGIVRASAKPRFSTAPVCLAAAADALAVLHADEPASGLLEIFSGAEKIEFFAPPPPEWGGFSLKIFAQRPKAGDLLATAVAELSGEDHRVFLKIEGLTSKILRISHQLHRVVLDPVSKYLSDEIPGELLPALPHEIVCRRIADDWPDDCDDALRTRIAAAIALSPSETENARMLSGTSMTRRHEWLFGRIAAKDSVRKCLFLRYGRQCGACDIIIDRDDAGKPSPRGEWRKTCGARMDISITHTPGSVVAAAAPNAILGIDAENRGRALSDDFTTFAFSRLEQEMAAESGDGETALLRFWCAKEALSKALGTGLRYGAEGLSAMAFDARSGKIEMEAVRLWLERFPELRGIRIPVHSCLAGNLVLAVCAFDGQP